MAKKERFLRQELRLIGHSPKSIAAMFDVTRETVNNWIRKDVFIPPYIAVELLELGVSKDAIRKPNLLV